MTTRAHFENARSHGKRFLRYKNEEPLNSKATPDDEKFHFLTLKLAQKIVITMCWKRIKAAGIKLRMKQIVNDWT